MLFRAHPRGRQWHGRKRPESRSSAEAKGCPRRTVPARPPPGPARPPPVPARTRPNPPGLRPASARPPRTVLRAGSENVLGNLARMNGRASLRAVAPPLPARRHSGNFIVTYGVWPGGGRFAAACPPAPSEAVGRSLLHLLTVQGPPPTVCAGRALSPSSPLCISSDEPSRTLTGGVCGWVRERSPVGWSAGRRAAVCVPRRSSDI